MKIGKVSQTILRRSMLKPIQFKNGNALTELSAEEMCYGVLNKEDEQILLSDAVLYGDEKDLGVFAFAQVMNDLATRGASLIGVSIHITLPPYAYESRLKTMTENVERLAASKGVQILNAKAEVSPVVEKAIIHVNGVGVVKKEKFLPSGQGKACQDIVLIGYVGLEGTFRAVRARAEELSKRFVPSFINGINQLEEKLIIDKPIALAREMGASAMQQIKSGGILGTLWEMADASGVGLEVDIKKMSIRQETIEICEFCHLNPYQLTSAGSALVFTERGEELVEKCMEQGICASILGRTTDLTERVILGGEEKRFLDKPAMDELLKLFE